MKDSKIEVGKFYKTKDGAKVRIYATDAGGQYPIHGAVLIKNNRWVARQWTKQGCFLIRTYIGDSDIISEWEDKPIFDNWDALPAWCDYAIAMDSTNKWFCFNKKPQLYLSSKWIVEPTSDVDYSIITKDYAPKNYNGDCKDSLLINPKYLNDTAE